MNSQTPLRMLDVPDPHGAPPLDQWAILSQRQPLVRTHANADALDPWSNCRSAFCLYPGRRDSTVHSHWSRQRNRWQVCVPTTVAALLAIRWAQGNTGRVDAAHNTKHSQASPIENSKAFLPKA
jgi:hypothetical protein